MRVEVGQRGAQPKEEKPQTDRKGVESPLIYRPANKKEPHQKISLKQTIHTPRNNDSFNASTIISSLVHANRSKIVANKGKPQQKEHKDDGFNRKEDFKLFPKRKISITQDVTSPNTRSTNRISEEGFDPRGSLTARVSTPRQSSRDTYMREQSSNKRREDLERQIKQITLKIDK